MFIFVYCCTFFLGGVLPNCAISLLLGILEVRTGVSGVQPRIFNFDSLRWCFVKRHLPLYTLAKANMDTQNGGFEKVVAFRYMAIFGILNFRGGKSGYVWLFWKKSMLNISGFQTLPGNEPTYPTQRGFAENHRLKKVPAGW